jgi:gliding motility-associated-like protein
MAMVQSGVCSIDTAAIGVITVNPNPIASSNAGDDITISLGNSVTLNGTGGATYSWSPTTGLDNPNISNPVASPLSTTTYVLTVTDGFSCASEDSVTVTVITDFNLVISNVMTPNGDGSNDTWIILNIANYPNTEIIVVNNQGQKVYSSPSYDNSWDGTFNGKPLPDATYYYFLKFANGGKVYSGAITIFNNKE